MKKYVSNLAFAVLLSVYVGNQAKAQEGFFDDFRDGSATDGTPITWLEGAGTFTVDTASDSLVINGSPDLGYATVHADATVYGDTSIRTRVRMLQGGLVGVAGRFSPTGCYAAGFEPNGVLAIGQCDVPDSSLGEVITDLDVTQEDVMLQFDMIGTTLSAWAWRPGEPRPVEPLVSVEDDKLQSGQVSVSVVGSPSIAEYRFVQVDTKSIPEPSAAVLMCIGLLAIGFRTVRRVPSCDSGY